MSYNCINCNISNIYVPYKILPNNSFCSKELATFDKNMKRNKNSALNLSDTYSFVNLQCHSNHIFEIIMPSALK